MNKLQEILKKNKAVLYIIILLIGFLGGYLIFAPSSKDKQTEKSLVKQYTCSMHPQIRQDKQGKCPLCGMDLIEVGSQDANSNIDPNAIMLTDEAMALANVQTMVVWQEDGEKILTLYGEIGVNERQSQIQSAYVNGRIEKLFINAVGDKVHKGQTIAKIYSPEVYTVAQELIAALNYPNTSQREALIEAAKEKLLLWNISQSQIDEIIATKKATAYTMLKANTSGTVVEKTVEQGDYITVGKSLMKIANLSSLWLNLKAYESDLPFLRKGQKVNFTCEALPSKHFTGVIDYIDDMIDNRTRTANIRVVINNQSGSFKPNMYAQAEIMANLSDYKGKIIVPKSAILWSGRYSVVYVKDMEQEQPTFVMRKVELGPSISGGYIINSGLEEGEEIVTNGVFQIDAAAQLEGKQSFMN